jgi:hypothetical protein
MTIEGTDEYFKAREGFVTSEFESCDFLNSEEEEKKLGLIRATCQLFDVTEIEGKYYAFPLPVM